MGKLPSWRLKGPLDVIAERHFETPSGKRFTVRIGRPRPFPDGQDWLCDYELIGPRTRRRRYAGGVDSLQALMQAMMMMGFEARMSKEYLAGGLTLYGNANLDLPEGPSLDHLPDRPPANDA